MSTLLSNMNSCSTFAQTHVRIACIILPTASLAPFVLGVLINVGFFQNGTHECAVRSLVGWLEIWRSPSFPAWMIIACAPRALSLYVTVVPCDRSNSASLLHSICLYGATTARAYSTMCGLPGLRCLAGSGFPESTLSG